MASGWNMLWFGAVVCDSNNVLLSSFIWFHFMCNVVFVFCKCCASLCIYLSYVRCMLTCFYVAFIGVYTMFIGVCVCVYDFVMCVLHALFYFCKTCISLSEVCVGLYTNPKPSKHSPTNSTWTPQNFPKATHVKQKLSHSWQRCPALQISDIDWKQGILYNPANLITFNQTSSVFCPRG